MDLDRIYTDLILEASTSKKNQREIENPDVEELGHNPSCGDEITIVVKFDGDKIADASYHGEGCAISKASTSFMIDTIKGQTIDQAKVIIQSYLDMIRGGKLTAEQMKSLKDARVLENIKNMPARVKCATLSWHTMQNILADK
ncbi:MAG: Fe-S cluster assembly sulfur transfer protein SufU [Ezakiella massiliensis]